MFTRFMISKAFRGFSRRAIRIFSRSVIEVPCIGAGDGTRCRDRLQRALSLDAVRSGSQAVLDRMRAANRLWASSGPALPRTLAVSSHGAFRIADIQP